MNIIIGAGPAGLSAAYHLKDKDFLILEKEQDTGGLCRSFSMSDTIFDYGGHAFFTKHDYVRQLIAELCPVPLYVQPRSAWVYSHDTFIPYPFQANLYGLPTEVVTECLMGLVSAASHANQHPPANIKEWIDQSFGEGIAKHFMLPYNQKIWAHPLEMLMPTWAGDRIVSPDVQSIVTGALSRVNFSQYPNAQVTYPEEGGFSNLFEGFVSRIGREKIVTQTEITSIDLARNTVTTNTNKEYSFKQLISTIPLTELVQKTQNLPDEVKQAVAELKHFSLYLVNLVYNRSQLTDKQRVYCASPEIPFHKLVLNSNSSPTLRNRKTFGIQAEVSFSPYKPVEEQGLTDQVINALLTMGIVTPDDELIANDIRILPLAYPVYTHEWKNAREVIFNFYEKHGVFCAGRFAEWLYINSDNAVLRGKVAAEKIEI